MPKWPRANNLKYLRPPARRLTRAAISALALAAASVALAQSTTQSSNQNSSQSQSASGNGFPTLYAGFGYGISFLTDRYTASKFGSYTYGFGIGIGGIDVGTTKGKFELDTELYSEFTSPDAYLLALVGIQYRRALVAKWAPGQKPPVFIPYAGASADMVGAYVDYPQVGINHAIRPGLAGTVFLGVGIARHAFIEARYLATTSVVGFNFSGVSIGAGYRFKL